MNIDFKQKPLIRLPNVIFEGEDGYQICTKTVLDTTTGQISFDKDGVSNYVHDYHKLCSNTIWRPQSVRQKEFDELLDIIKNENKKNKFDCILGLSGGVDSSYLAHLAYKSGLRVLCVHFDYGWNTEQAVNNINKIIKKTGFELYTYVIDWEKFKELQKAYFKAGVLDLDIPADHLINGSLYRVARKFNVQHILSGVNFANEGILPGDWFGSVYKNDYISLKYINKTYGSGSIKSIPTLSAERRYFYELNFKLYPIDLLNKIDYSKSLAINVLREKYDWEYYGGKHHETVFTRWYQACYLPLIYGIDKRRAHLSNLILNKEISREEALEVLKEPPYPYQNQLDDCVYVAKKWGFTESEFLSVLFDTKREISSFPKESDFIPKMVRIIKKIPIKFASLMNVKSDYRKI